MPELPEVETMRRGVAPIVGAVVTAARRHPCRCKPILIEPRPAALRHHVVGKRVVAIERLGKRVVIRLEDRSALVIEPRMTGLVLLADPPNRTHLRFRMDLELPGREPAVLWYWDRRGLGTIRWWTEEQLASRLGPEALGPDALEVSCDQLRARFSHSRRPIKPALLDQRCLAGVGNLYASELLHRARIHPETPCDAITAAAWRRVHRALLDVLHEAIAHEGSTLSDGTYRNALNQSGSYQTRHRVYDRAGEKCPQCQRAEVRRIVQAQRATFFCPCCQDASPRIRGVS